MTQLISSFQKLGIREYVKGLGVGYTIIDVGWWMQICLPLPLRSQAATPLDRKSTRLNSSHSGESRMPSSA